MLDEIRNGIFTIDRAMKEREPNLHLELTRVEEIAANLRKLIEMNGVEN